MLSTDNLSLCPFVFMSWGGMLPSCNMFSCNSFLSFLQFNGSSLVGLVSSDAFGISRLLFSFSDARSGLLSLSIASFNCFIKKQNIPN
ncbi:hypothetical protein Hanom_Chr05g00389471 [Helianthus anomalus]